MFFLCLVFVHFRTFHFLSLLADDKHKCVRLAKRKVRSELAVFSFFRHSLLFPTTFVPRLMVDKVLQEMNK